MFDWLKRKPGESPQDFKFRQEVIDISPKREISEPVLSIVKCMGKYPSRWKLQDKSQKENGFQYTVKDVKTGLVVIQYVSNFSGYGDYHKTTIKNLKLTFDEEQAMHTALMDIYYTKMSRLSSIKDLEARRIDTIERKRLTEIYK